MERITMSLEESLAREFDELVRARGYTSRSEAMRDLLRRELEAQRLAHETKTHCVANLSYIYNHETRSLSDRLMKAQHQHHDLVISTMHVHLDHDHSLESVVLKGPAADVKGFADLVQAERGVRYVHINLVTVNPGDSHRAPASHHHHHGHLHLIPRS